MKPSEKAALIRAWIDLEMLKREMRGIPRLKPADVSRLLKRAKTTLQSDEPIEVEEVSPTEASMPALSPGQAG